MSAGDQKMYLIVTNFADKVFMGSAIYARFQLFQRLTLNEN